jgi:hypothetical protein
VFLGLGIISSTSLYKHPHWPPNFSGLFTDRSQGMSTQAADRTLPQIKGWGAEQDLPSEQEKQNFSYIYSLTLQKKLCMTVPLASKREEVEWLFFLLNIFQWYENSFFLTASQYVAQNPPVPASEVLGLQVCATIPGWKFFSSSSCSWICACVFGEVGGRHTPRTIVMNFIWNHLIFLDIHWQILFC